ncbi:hypothetical protein [Mucilaginibacter sp. SP1R1]|uniref:hypothetical protein n=1 Tax=Mucilaginibacter sp. SP1R1 TaxID=2723091 RepID=UPI0016183FA1|nr:hypothetical protein [Mucilaginibacter sp. SP1R1]MBB6149472.1 hypothetical protein [Mucilaginibacter sp. SP1R1]
MSNFNVRSFLAVMIIGTYVLLTIVATVYPVLNIHNFDLDKFSAYFTKVSGSLTGLVGAILGFYFGKADNKATGESDNFTTSDHNPVPYQPIPTEPTPVVPPPSGAKNS